MSTRLNSAHDSLSRSCLVSLANTRIIETKKNPTNPSVQCPDLCIMKSHGLRLHQCRVSTFILKITPFDII